MEESIISHRNVAYSINSNGEDNVYETLPSLGGTLPHDLPEEDLNAATGKEVSIKVRVLCYTVVTILALVIAVFSLIMASVGVIYESQINKQEIQELNIQLNHTRQRIQTLFQADQNIIATLKLEGISYPASSCSDIPQYKPSGEYWIATDSTSSPVRVYCDMDRTSCSCNTTGGWMRVANLDMTDSNQNCPDGFRLVSRTTPPLRTCGRPGPAGCVSTTYPTYGVEYSRVCGRVIGYQDKTTDAFDPYFDNRTLSIDDVYVDGVSVTHGQSPRQHIWTFANAADETRSTNLVCPCTRPDIPYTGVVPPFIGQDYFCETGSRQEISRIFYSDDPLWDGQGCGRASTCCEFNNPPWFCKQLPQPTTGDIELRLCANLDVDNENTPLEIIEIYVQ
ncbi:uncharacterized protein LOC135347143 [Halichondria panicea]|uniref:uncharacterized protein LOC135347143 n=1 Tax=Halichondria panicea TaxID=6063 RepID=UPI00312B4FD5